MDVPGVHRSREGQLGESHLENVSQTLDERVIQYRQLTRRNSNGSVDGIAHFCRHGSDVAQTSRQILFERLWCDQNGAIVAEKFIDVLGKRVVLMDGAMATELYDEGVFINMSYDALSLSKPALVEKVHRSYRKAGAEVLTTNTFGANRFRLMPFGKEAEVAAINAASARIARKVAGQQAWVAGSIGPTGVQLSPIGMISPGEAYAAYREQAAVLAEEGVDLFLLETFSSLKEAWQAFRACRKVAPDIPILVCMSFHYDLSGT